MGRAPCCDKASVKRGHWSPEEDATLRTHIESYGIGGGWIALPKKAGLPRCGKSCRLRWLNYLRPDIKHGGFTKEEDNIIYTLFNNIGSRWSVIASHLPGRTDNDVKNYWNTKLKKKLAPAQKPKQTPMLPSDDIHNATPLDWGFGFLAQDPYPILPEFPPLPTSNQSSAASSSVDNHDGGFFSEMCFGNYCDLLNALV